MEPQVFIILSAIPELKEYFGDRIYNGSAPLCSTPPYLVWFGVGSTPEHAIDCGTIADNDDYQFVIWTHDTDIPAANRMRYIARETLEKAGLIYSGKLPDLSDTETKLQSRGFSMNYWCN